MNQEQINLIVTLLLAIVTILTAVWNALVIKWHFTSDKKYSKQWHSVGLAIRIILTVVTYLVSGFWWALAVFFLSWIPYNIIISWIVWGKFWHLSDDGIDGFIKRLLKLKS